MRHIVLACESYGDACVVGDRLEDNGYRVDIVEGGLKAFGFIKFSERSMDRVDTVVACVTSEDSVNGELLEQLRRERPQLPVVVLRSCPTGAAECELDTLLGKLAALRALEMPTTQEAARLSA